MAKTVFIRKRDGQIMPSDSVSEQILNDLQPNITVKAVITQPRNIKHHQKFFVGLNKVWETQGYYETPELLRKAFLGYIGHYEEVKIKAETFIAIKSMDFASMDQQEFQEVYEKFLQFISEVVMPGVDDEDLRRELEEFL